MKRLNAIIIVLLTGALFLGAAHLWRSRERGTVSREDIIDMLTLPQGKQVDWYSGGHRDGATLCLHIRDGYTSGLGVEPFTLRGLSYDAEKQTLYDEASGRTYTDVDITTYETLSGGLRVACEERGYSLSQVLTLYSLMENDPMFSSADDDIISAGWNSSGVYVRLSPDSADPERTKRLILAKYPKYAHCIHFSEERWLSSGHSDMPQ